jgi:hypothetical protein
VPTTPVVPTTPAATPVVTPTPLTPQLAPQNPLLKFE